MNFRSNYNNIPLLLWINQRKLAGGYLAEIIPDSPGLFTFPTCQFFYQDQVHFT